MRQGSACSLELRCTHCGSIATEMSSVRSSTNHNSYDVNRPIEASAVASGMGFTQTMNFFSLMGMPKPMSSRQWHNYKGTINTKAGEAVEEHLQEAVKEVRRTYVDRGLGMPDDEGVMDIVVSVDGSWQKRGHKSHNGVVAVVEHHTGLIIYSVALSNYCRHCNSAPKPDDPGFVAWQRNHQLHCQKNMDCASGAMEVEGALILFSRSVDKHKLRYTQMLGDGDAKTHARIEAGDPFEGRPVLKLECVNHVAKRLGTGLRDLKAKLGAQGQSIGGRGKLTDDRIKQLTGYYGRAIKDNVGDLDGMVAAVWASYFHVTSTDDSHDHSLCPTGSDGWCFHQRATADGVTPRPHSKSLPADVAAAIRPLYVRLSDRTLLTRCLHGWTQNDNECFHSGLWSLCSKTKWAGLATVEMCLALAVQQFNKGASAHLDLLRKVDITPSRALEEYCEKKDVKRMQHSSRNSTLKEKQRRQKIDDAKRAEMEACRRGDGVNYAGGGF